MLLYSIATPPQAPTTDGSNPPAPRKAAMLSLRFELPLLLFSVFCTIAFPMNPKPMLAETFIRLKHNQLYVNTPVLAMSCMHDPTNMASYLH